MKTFQERVEGWADDRNLIKGSSAAVQLSKLLEEAGELATAIATGDIEYAMDSIGDMSVVLTIMAAQIGSSLEECQDLAWNEIKNRKGRMVDGLFVKES
jgi:NTP pyrophosphatase (non-canonical NTP hydrolase)